MKLPANIREQFQNYGRAGGVARANRLSWEERRSIARKAATARWTRERFGAASFASLGLPGGELVDRGLADLQSGEVTLESLLISLAAPRLRREGVPIGSVDSNPEKRFYRLVSQTAGDLAHARYNAYRRQIVSFSDACRILRRDLDRRRDREQGAS